MKVTVAVVLAIIVTLGTCTDIPGNEVEGKNIISTIHGRRVLRINPLASAIILNFLCYFYSFFE
jgi:hypothetical protein